MDVEIKTWLLERTRERKRISNSEAQGTVRVRLNKDGDIVQVCKTSKAGLENAFSSNTDVRNSLKGAKVSLWVDKDVSAFHTLGD